MPTPKQLMQLAIADASGADYPFGAVIVKNGKVIAHVGSGGTGTDCTEHAETTAIRLACKKLKSTSLEGCELYGSCEPCLMCFGAAWYAGIRKITCGSSIRQLNSLNWGWGENHLGVNAALLKKSGIALKQGIMAKEVMAMYRQHPKFPKPKKS